MIKKAFISCAMILTFTTLCSYASIIFTPEQEPQIKDLILKTIIENPYILNEAADQLVQKEIRKSEIIQQIIKINQNHVSNHTDSPRIGMKKTKYIMIYFTDYNCNFCKKLEKNLQTLINNYPQIGIVLKPLAFHSDSSTIAAQFAISVWEQYPEKFSKFHNLLMSKKGNHDRKSIELALEKCGIKLKKPNKTSINAVNNNLLLAQQLGINGTPVVIIGNNIIKGVLQYQQLEDVLIYTYPNLYNKIHNK